MPEYARILRLRKNGKLNYALEYVCLDPANIASQIINKTFSTILMSGSLTPVEAYLDFLGFDKSRAEAIELPRSKEDFPPENSLILIDISVTTWIKRRATQIEMIAKHVEGIVNSTPGSSIVYFPSYELLNQVSQLIKLNKKVLIESPGMTENERIKIIKELKRKILLAVLNGKFARGVDLPGILKSVVIVGVPVRPPDVFSKLLENYYASKFNSKEIGALYAWRIPAINAAIQAAGRLIRDKNDVGVIAFLDNRYCFVKDYYKILPVEYRKYKKIVREPSEAVINFWKNFLK